MACIKNEEIELEKTSVNESKSINDFAYQEAPIANTNSSTDPKLLNEDKVVGYASEILNKPTNDTSELEKNE